MGNHALRVRHAALVVGALLLAAAHAAAAMGFTVKPDRTVAAVGQTIVVTAAVTSSKDLGRVAPPSVPSSEYFDVLQTSQNQSHSSSIQIVNGKTERTVEITYYFYYTIAPKKTGSFTFPVLQIDAGGTTLTSQPFTIEVTSEPVRNPDIVVRLSPSKTSVYAGEQCVLTVRVGHKPDSPVQLTNEGFAGLIGDIESALGKSFSFIRLTGDKLGRSQEHIGGESYVVYKIVYALFGHTAGTHRIPGVGFTYNELKRAERRRSFDPFEDFFGGGLFGSRVTAEPKRTHSNALSITVRPLPKPPSDYGGAVGRIMLSASVDPATIPAGEAATCRVTLRGNTRPGSIGDVRLPELPDFEVFTPEKSVSADTTENGIGTHKTYRYLLIAKREGEMEIPAISYTYFDPASGSYRTARAGPFPLTVTKGVAGPKTRSRYLTQADIQEVGKDIRYIKIPDRLHDQIDKPYRSPLFLVLYPVPFLIALFSLLYRVQSTRREKDLAGLKRRRAFGEALADMRRLRRKAGRLSEADFLGRITEIAERYFTDRLAFAAAGMTIGEITEQLREAGVSAETVEAARRLLEQVAALRFGGVSAGEHSRVDATRDLEGVIRRVDDETRRARKT